MTDKIIRNPKQRNSTSHKPVNRYSARSNPANRYSDRPGTSKPSIPTSLAIAGRLAVLGGTATVIVTDLPSPETDKNDYPILTTPKPPVSQDFTTMVTLAGEHVPISPPTPFEVAVFSGPTTIENAINIFWKNEVSPQEQNDQFKSVFDFEWPGKEVVKTGGSKTYGIPDSIIPINISSDIRYFKEINPAYKITPPHPAEIYRHIVENQSSLPEKSQQFLTEYAQIWNNGQFNHEDYWKISENLQQLWKKYPQSEYSKYIIALFNPEKNNRYTPSETETWCQIWMMDMMNLMYGPQYYVPHTVYYNGDNNSTQRQSNANMFIESVMSYGGIGRGWVSIDAQTAQGLAKDGIPIFAGAQNRVGSGHVFILMADKNGEIIVSQAGSQNIGISIDNNGDVSGTIFRDYVEKHWSPHNQYTSLQFWVHKTAIESEDDIAVDSVTQQTGVEALQEIIPGINIFASSRFIPQPGQRIVEKSEGLIGHNNQTTEGHAGNIYPSEFNSNEIQLQKAQNVIVHWATGASTIGTVDQVMQSRGRSIHFSIYINPQTQKPEINVIAPFGFINNKLIVSQVMGAGLLGDQMHGLQFEIAGEYFQNQLNNPTQAQIDQLETMTDSEIDHAFISDDYLAQMTTVIVDLLYGLCQRGAMQPSDILGHFQLSLVGSPDPSPQYLGYIQSRVLNKLATNDDIQPYVYQRIIKNLAFSPLHNIEQSSSSTVDYFFHYYGLLNRGIPFSKGNVDEVFNGNYSSGSSQSYEGYHRRTVAQSQTPISRRDFSAIQKAISEGKLPQDSIERAYGRKVLASQVTRAYSHVNPQKIKELCVSLSKEGIVALIAWRIYSCNSILKSVWKEASEDIRFVELLSEISKLSLEIVQEALLQGYTPLEILRRILP